MKRTERRNKLSEYIAIVQCACAILIFGIWWFVAHNYAKQDMSLQTMLHYEFSHENPEWMSAFWAVVYPICAIGLAIIYWISSVPDSRTGAVALACITTALGASAFLFIFWPVAVALNVPSAIAWVVARMSQAAQS